MFGAPTLEDQLKCKAVFLLRARELTFQSVAKPEISVQTCFEHRIANRSDISHRRVQVLSALPSLSTQK
jgi:hypothetical protein